MTARKTAHTHYWVPCPGCGKPALIVCTHGAVAVTIPAGVSGEGDT